MVELVSSGKIVPVVDRTYPLAEVEAAFERLERGDQFGKVIVECAPAAHTAHARSGSE